MRNIPEPDIEGTFQQAMRYLSENVTHEKPPTLDGVLFLIGIQELGQGLRTFSKEEKQDLMHIGVCKVLSLGGYYELQGLDEEGWPHWQAAKPLPNQSLTGQETMLKGYVIAYLESELGWHA
jgi:hypothetical protein